MDAFPLGAKGSSCVSARLLALGLGLIVLCSASPAQETGYQLVRSFDKIGGSFTIGDSRDPGNIGYGMKSQTFTFFDASNRSGLYYGFAGADATHTVGGVTILDTRIATLGYRLEAQHSPFGLDCSLSPVMGSRSVGNRIFGTFYVGLQPVVGVFVTFSKDIDHELSYEPNIGLFRFFESEEIKNQSYHDLTLSILLKSLRQSRKLSWF